MSNTTPDLINLFVMISIILGIRSLASVEGESKSLTMDLGKYGIDVIADGDKVYFPLSTASDLFYISYNGAEYVDGNIYFVHMMDETTKSYFDRTPLYQTSQRSPVMVEYTYNELCFLVDTYYGGPMKAEIASSIMEKRFDKTLDEFSDETRRAKELLKATPHISKKYRIQKKNTRQPSRV